MPNMPSPVVRDYIGENERKKKMLTDVGGSIQYGIAARDALAVEKTKVY